MENYNNTVGGKSSPAEMRLMLDGMRDRARLSELESENIRLKCMYTDLTIANGLIREILLVYAGHLATSLLAMPHDTAIAVAKEWAENK